MRWMNLKWSNIIGEIPIPYFLRKLENSDRWYLLRGWTWIYPSNDLGPESPARFLIQEIHHKMPKKNIPHFLNSEVLRGP